MENFKSTSQGPTDTKHPSVKRGHATPLNEQTDIEHLVEHDILHALIEYDPKLHFSCTPIVAHDQVLKHRCRQTCGLIWNAIRSPNVSRLVPYDRSCAFVEILRIPTNWSRYDTDLLLFEIRHRKFLNGLALRDELVRVLQIVLKRDFQQNATSLYEFDELDFTRNTIQLTFHRRRGKEVTLMVSLVLLVEFDVPCTTFFPDTYTSLCKHEIFSGYFQNHPDVKRTCFTPSNSIKFRFDSSLTETHLCDYLIAQSSPFSSMLANFFKLRKQWLKHLPRAVKHATETVTKQPHFDQLCASTRLLKPKQSTTSNAAGLLPPEPLLSTEIEEAFECLLSVPLLRLLFVTACSELNAFASGQSINTAHVIVGALQLLADALENNYLEHPFSKGANALAESPSTDDKRVQLGIARLINEMQRDWKRSLPR